MEFNCHLSCWDWNGSFLSFSNVSECQNAHDIATLLHKNDKTEWNNTTHLTQKHSHKWAIDAVTHMSFIHQFGFSHLGMKELFKHVSALVVISVGLVERSAVCEQSCHVSNEQMLVNVIVALQTIANRLQIYRTILPQKHDCIYFIFTAIFPWLTSLLAGPQKSNMMVKILICIFEMTPFSVFCIKEQ